jgi:tRNA threonylcarbamoyl adenosine modification protein (Sua5/YciO/YrdC/YwlC family)
MSQFFRIHPVSPQPRLIQQAAAIVRDGGVIAYPTDSCYAMGSAVGNKAGMERIVRIRNMDSRHFFTLICRDLSELTQYARVDTPVYRLLKANTPGPYAFVLPATREAPRRLRDPKRRTIGLRVPDHRITQDLLAELNAPMMTSSLILPGDEQPMNDPEAIRTRLEHELDLVIDGGPCHLEPTTVVDLTGDVPRVLRVGKGDPAPFR